MARTTRRTSTATAELEDVALPGLDDLQTDPEPAPAKRTRRARSSATSSPRTTTSRGRIGTRSSSGRIMSKAAMVDKVTTELHFFLGLGFSVASVREPCLEAIFEPMEMAGPNGQPIEVDRVGVVAERLTAMIARNDKLLKFAAESGIIGDAIMLASALAPVGQAIWRAHGPGGTGHGEPKEGTTSDVDRYRAYVPAAAAA